MHGSGEFAYALAVKGLIDEYEVYLNPLVWGEGNVHVLGDRGTVLRALEDVKRFDSGVVLLTYLPLLEANDTEKGHAMKRTVNEFVSLNSR